MWSRFFVTLTLVTQQPLSSVGAETHGLQWRLWDACGSVTAGVALTGVELAQPACVERGALTEPVLSITKRVNIEGDIIRPEVKMDHDIAATCPDALQAHTVAYRTHRERSDSKTTNPVMHERFEKMLLKHKHLSEYADFGGEK